MEINIKAQILLMPYNAWFERPRSLTVLKIREVHLLAKENRNQR